ncbi:hypothetical protein FQS90_09500 [Enterococcus casseliflavus]|uniref:hypothetical protein n=1 Tax=Enterococcus sp. 8E11_MSG4843 TaxID=1834190 RepID=UPI000B3EBB47|nr:hypothetical protein [Enterococcus sp. 8E11_MSG4843]MBO1096757.1 hypothetical protein [Enterococcus casseliflavus]MBO1145079.1 hypothetical protein [Enterococcus casseliflavus]OUZ36782.1 hypothetical protein A5885_000971 [Enterococcus sp. 8E11_MSG4843]
MRIAIDTIGRIHLIDEYKPYGSIVFDIDKKNDRVGVYQDSDDEDVRIQFETIEESAEFDREELIQGLEQVIENLKEAL